MHFLKKTGLLILLTVTLLVSPLSWAATPTALLAKQDYLYDAFFKLETVDLIGRGNDQLVVLGRDYTGQRISVQLLSWANGDLVSEWESPNLIAERPVAMAAGAPLPTGEQVILVLTQKHLYLYTYQNERITLFDQIYHALSPFDLSVADLDGDGIDELLIVNLGKRMANYDEKVVDVYRLDGHELRKLGSSPLLGNIRCLVGGDLDGDGRAEVVVESGLSYRAGTFTLLRWEPAEARLVPAIKGQKLLSSLALGMQVVSEGKKRALLYTADGWGRLNFFQVEKDKFLSSRPEYSFPNGLVGVAAGDLDGDGRIEGVVAGHPNNLMVFSIDIPEETALLEEITVEGSAQPEAVAAVEMSPETGAGGEMIPEENGEITGSGAEPGKEGGKRAESAGGEEAASTEGEKGNPPAAVPGAKSETGSAIAGSGGEARTGDHEEQAAVAKTEETTKEESGITISGEVEVTVEW